MGSFNAGCLKHEHFTANLVLELPQLYKPFDDGIVTIDKLALLRPFDPINHVAIQSFGQTFANLREYPH